MNWIHGLARPVADVIRDSLNKELGNRKDSRTILPREQARDAATVLRNAEFNFHEAFRSRHGDV